MKGNVVMCFSAFDAFADDGSVLYDEGTHGAIAALPCKPGELYTSFHKDFVLRLFCVVHRGCVCVCVCGDRLCCVGECSFLLAGRWVILIAETTSEVRRRHRHTPSMSRFIVGIS